jgi:hypothetical protein
MPHIQQDAYSLTFTASEEAWARMEEMAEAMGCPSFDRLFAKALRIMHRILEKMTDGWSVRPPKRTESVLEPVARNDAPADSGRGRRALATDGFAWCEGDGADAYMRIQLRCKPSYVQEIERVHALCERLGACTSADRIIKASVRLLDLFLAYEDEPLEVFLLKGGRTQRLLLREVA